MNETTTSDRMVRAFELEIADLRRQLEEARVRIDAWRADAYGLAVERDALRARLRSLGETP